MIQIRSKIKVAYKAVNPEKKAFVVIQMPYTIDENATHVNFTINRYWVKEDIIHNENNETEIVESLIFLESLPISLPNEKVDQLATYVKTQVPTELSETQWRNILKQQALLYYVQNDFIDNDENGENGTKTIFGLNPNDWEIINNNK